jgi:hypothetical protein
MKIDAIGYNIKINCYDVQNVYKFILVEKNKQLVGCS